MEIRKKYMIFPALLVISITFYYRYLTNEAMLYCYGQDKYLSDKEFIRSALQLELDRNRLPDGYKISSIDGFLSENPTCCSVERGYHRFAQKWVADRLLLGTTVITSVTISAPDEEKRVLVIDYLMTGCGHRSERFEGFRTKIT